MARKSKTPKTLPLIAPPTEPPPEAQDYDRRTPEPLDLDALARVVAGRGSVWIKRDRPFDFPIRSDAPTVVLSNEPGPRVVRANLYNGHLDRRRSKTLDLHAAKPVAQRLSGFVF